MNLMKNRAIFVIQFLLLAQLALAQQNTHTVFIVRHAEKVSAAPDALLSPAGVKRAECLAKTLKDAGITSIFATEFKRTQQTAEPLAAALGLKVTVVPANDWSTLTKDLLYGLHGNALVVGHSETVPVLVQRLQAGSIPPIGFNEFDRMMVVSLVSGGGSTQVTTLHYCELQGAAATAPGSEMKRPGTKK